MIRGAALALLAVLALGACSRAAPPRAPEVWPQVAAATPAPDARRIAVVPFAQPGAAPVSLAKIVATDLAGTGRFHVLAPAQLPQQPATAADVDYAAWRATGAEYLVLGRVAAARAGLSAQVELVDVAGGAAVASFELDAPGAAGARSLGHRIADLAYARLTGAPGHFNSQIAYVTAAGEGRARVFHLRVIDSDGANARTLASSPEPLMSPSWSPDRRQLAYVGFERGRSTIYLHTLASGQLRRLVQEPGINGAPAWSPDGREVAATLSFGRNPDIYVIDVASGARRQLTQHAAIDTEPSWSPDGRQLAFTSDRDGQPQVYLVAAGGGEPRRLTYEGTQNLRPRFSPDGRALALVNAQGTSYRIALLDLATRRLRVLSDGPRDESPSFAPNGAVVVYAAQGQQGVELATVTVDGRIRQRLRQPGEVREPSWSPLIR